MAARFDLVVWGASGFVGRLVVEDLLTRYRDAPVCWAMAGRNAAKLEAIRAQLGDAAAGVPILIADSHDAESLEALARQARVVCATVGPYALHGSQLVAACARHGTHYCDITGETQWIREMIDRHQQAARESGALLVPCCGFDSIPSDLGCLMMNEAMIARHGGPCDGVKLRVKGVRGGFSGGTVASMLSLIEQAHRDPAVRRLLTDPYALNPTGAHRGPDRTEGRGVEWDADFASWIAPFIMASINTRIVRRSNALMEYPYGRDFRYSEAVLTGAGVTGRIRATLIAAGLSAFLAGAVFPPSRALMNRFLLPQPGQGPSRQQRDSGFFDLRLRGWRGESQLRGKVSGGEDPGYGATSKMLTESALCLANGESQLAGGFWTPASALGRPLLARLQDAGIVQFEISDT